MQLYLADTSAWSRSGASSRLQERWNRLLAREALAMCGPVALELLYSARSRAEYAVLAADLATLPQLAVDEHVVRTATDTQAQLAQRSRHRGPKPIALLIAATAELYGATLLHYDRHFDAIARVTGQPCEWVARRGSLD